MTSPELLASATRGSVVAAAGCGKTELIARSVAVGAGRQLVLTHTNAGVDALRRRLRRCGVASDQSNVDTVAGWSLKYILSFPARSGGIPLKADGSTNWDEIYPRMTALLHADIVRKVITASYAGAYVDEYQDCDEAQHALVSALAEILPVRILGDPLQAVFRFAGALPPWAAAVEAAFPRVGLLTTPWRWRREGHNQALGDWLGEARDTLEAMQPLDLSRGPLRLVRTPSFGGWQEVGRTTCFEAADEGGTCVAVLKWPGDYQRLGRVTGGLFQCVEPIDARDARDWLVRLERSLPENRWVRVQEFLRVIAIHVDEAMRPVEEALNGPDHGPAPADVRHVIELIELVGRPNSGTAVAGELLSSLAALPGLRVFRRELLWAAVDTLHDAAEAGYVDLQSVLRHRRNLTSHIGRRLARRTVGSILLLKGMEFDHAIVIDTGHFSLQDIYVALTRGSKSLTVLSPRTVIDPNALADA